MATYFETLDYYEQLLVTQGLESMGREEKNMLVQRVAEKEGKTFFEVTNEYMLEHHKKLKSEMLNEDCENHIIAGFLATNGNHYRTNRDDQVNMVGQKDELNDDESIKIVYWKTVNKGYLEHTREEWLKVYLEAFKHKKIQLFHYDSLKNEVSVAKTHEEIVVIQWIVEEEAEVEESLPEEDYGGAPPVEGPVENPPLEPEGVPMEESVEEGDK